MEGAEAADRIHHERHANAGLCPFAKRPDEAVADIAFLEDVALHVDRFARARESRRASPDRTRAVGKDLDRVARGERGVAGRFQNVEKVVAAGIDGCLDVVRDPRGEQRRQGSARR